MFRIVNDFSLMSHRMTSCCSVRRQLIGTQLEAPKTTMANITASPGGPNATTIGEPCRRPSSCNLWNSEDELQLPCRLSGGGAA